MTDPSGYGHPARGTTTMLTMLNGMRYAWPLDKYQVVLHYRGLTLVLIKGEGKFLLYYGDKTYMYTAPGETCEHERPIDYLGNVSEEALLRGGDTWVGVLVHNIAAQLPAHSQPDIAERALLERRLIELRDTAVRLGGLPSSWPRVESNTPMEM